jgi:aminopeptidase-like protein
MRCRAGRRSSIGWCPYEIARFTPYGYDERQFCGQHQLPIAEFALLWVLNLSDGRHSLLDIAERSGLSFEAVRKAADDLLAHDLLRPVVE